MYDRHQRIFATSNWIEDKDWEKLFGLIPEIRNTERFGDMKGRYLIESEVVIKFAAAYMNWELFRILTGQAGMREVKILRNKEQDFKQLDTITLCKLFTAIVREDRFNGGHLISQFENGTLLKIVEALQKHVSKQPLPK